MPIDPNTQTLYILSETDDVALCRQLLVSQVIELASTDEANMTMNPTYKDLGSKKEEEEEEEEDEIKLPKMPSCSSSKQWSSSFKNPRIVRVSRNFAGKDRHSKVCTVRGLRDRRIRLSVPTAIQLYDLQERLNLTQPSKVIDWLLDATKQEIDQLPPLPSIPTNFLHFNPNNNPLHHHPSSSSYVSDFLSPPNLFKGRERYQENGEQKNFFPLNSNHEFSVPNLAYNPNYFSLEPPNLSLSQFGGGFSHNHQEHTGCSLPSSSSPPRDSSSQMNYMSSTTTTHFPPYFAGVPSLENDHHFRQMNSSTLHNLINSPMKSFSLDVEREDI